MEVSLKYHPRYSSKISYVEFCGLSLSQNLFELSFFFLHFVSCVLYALNRISRSINFLIWITSIFSKLKQYAQNNMLKSYKTRCLEVTKQLRASSLNSSYKFIIFIYFLKRLAKVATHFIENIIVLQSLHHSSTSKSKFSLSNHNTS